MAFNLHRDRYGSSRAGTPSGEVGHEVSNDSSRSIEACFVIPLCLTTSRARIQLQSSHPATFPRAWRHRQSPLLGTV